MSALTPPCAVRGCASPSVHRPLVPTKIDVTGWTRDGRRSWAAGEERERPLCVRHYRDVVALEIVAL